MFECNQSSRYSFSDRFCCQGHWDRRRRRRYEERQEHCKVCALVVILPFTCLILSWSVNSTGRPRPRPRSTVRAKVAKGDDDDNAYVFSSFFNFILLLTLYTASRFPAAMMPWASKALGAQKGDVESDICFYSPSNVSIVLCPLTTKSGARLPHLEGTWPFSLEDSCCTHSWTADLPSQRHPVLRPGAQSLKLHVYCTSFIYYVNFQEAFCVCYDFPYYRRRGFQASVLILYISFCLYAFPGCWIALRNAWLLHRRSDLTIPLRQQRPSRGFWRSQGLLCLCELLSSQYMACLTIGQQKCV